jgi:hypothetical protein
VSRLLLVTEATRSVGEFRRPWVRRLWAAYVRRHRAAVIRAAARLARGHELTVLTARQLVEPDALPAGVDVRYYDDESSRADSRALADATRCLTADWWPTAAQEPSLRYRGVWLPDLLTVAKGLVLRFEVTEHLGVLEQAFDETKPERVWLLGGASVPERLAGLLAAARHVETRVAWSSPWPSLVARAQAALFPREERIRLRALLEQPRRNPPPPGPVAGRRLLFVTCRSRHHFVVDPLVEAVRAEGAVPHVLASSDEDPELRDRVEALGGAGIPVAYGMDHLPAAEARALVRRHRPMFLSLWRRIARDPGLAARTSWRGVSLLPVLRPFLRVAAEQSLLTALLHQEAAFRALDAVRPDAVVITSDRRYAERAVALAARVRGIPSVLCSGTLLLSRDRTNAFDVGDRLLVIGEHLRDGLVREQGVDPARVVVIGDPRSNAARLLPAAALRAEVCRDLGLDPARPLVVLISKYVSLLFSPAEREALYRTTFGAVARLGAAQVVVKVHPNENLELLRGQVREWECPQALLVKDYDIHRLFGAADAAVMVTSMAGLEAMAMDCPVVAVQTPGKDFEGQYMPPYVTAGAARRADLGDPASLAAVLGPVLTDPAVRADLVERGRRFSAPYIHPVDGRLATRLLRTVDELRSARVGP